MTKKDKYYDVSDILKHKATYNIIYGERSNGKTVALLKRIIDRYVEDGHQGVYLRRSDVDIKGTAKEEIFGAIVQELDYVRKKTKGEWEFIRSQGHKFFFARIDKDTGRVVKSTEPFCYALALSQTETNKGKSFPKVGTIVFDEFLTQDKELPTEFRLFMNTISTIVRHRDTVQIFLLGNTVNMHSVYFNEFNIYKQVKQMKQGTIQLFKFTDSKMTIAVEYCANILEKKSNKYFDIDSSSMNMIKNGAWEFPYFPQLPVEYQEYRPMDIVSTFYLFLQDEVYQGNVVALDDAMFVHMYPKTSYERLNDEKKKEVDECLQYHLDPRPEFNRQVYLTRNNSSKLTKLISQLYAMKRFFYANNITGMAVKQYINNEPN